MKFGQVFSDIVDFFFRNQDIGANEYTQKLITRESYDALFSPVFSMYFSGRGQEIKRSEYYDRLFYQSGLQEKISTFINSQKRTAGIAISFGTMHHRDVLFCGNQQEIDDDTNVKIIPIKRNSIFDMASITKVFTCLMTLKLVDCNMLQLSNVIFDLDNRFVNLKEVTINDLLSFKTPLVTANRIENAQNMEEIEKLLFGIKPSFTNIGRLYSDMGAIVLKYVIEQVTGREFYDLIREYILKPCDMQDTLIEIAPENLERTVSNNFERRIYRSEYVVIDGIKKGVINDGKARKINEFKRQLHGHAGMFSTVDDMANLCQTLMQGKILSSKWLNIIGKNQTGMRQKDGSFSQFHGLLCYSKNPIEKYSEVNHFLSGNAFALGGYTGNQLTIDTQNQVFVFMASNRCHNRVTQIIDADSNTLVSDGYVAWNDGHKYPYNKNYAFDRDEYIVAPAVQLALQYRFLEYLFERDGEVIEDTVLERNIL